MLAVVKALKTRGQLREHIRALEKKLRDVRRENETLKYALAENTVIAGDLISFLKMKSLNPLRRFTGWLVRIQMRQDEKPGFDYSGIDKSKAPNGWAKHDITIG